MKGSMKKIIVPCTNSAQIVNQHSFNKVTKRKSIPILSKIVFANTMKKLEKK